MPTDSKKDKLTTSSFLSKLSKMVDNEELIQWSNDGTSFIIARCNDFAKDTLPRYFKHDNFQAFVHQLNMYGFQDLQQGNLRTNSEPDRWEFRHEYFQRGNPDLFKQIQRKKERQPSIGSNSSGIDADISILVEQQTVLESNLKQILTSFDSRFKQVENENISMWRELKRQNKTIKTLTSRYSINSAENVLGYLLTHQVDNGNGSTTLNTIVTNMTNGPDFLPAPQTVFAPSDESSSALPNVADNIIMTQESIDTPSQQINILDSLGKQLRGDGRPIRIPSARRPTMPR